MCPLNILKIPLLFSTRADFFISSLFYLFLLWFCNGNGFFIFLVVYTFSHNPTLKSPTRIVGASQVAQW